MSAYLKIVGLLCLVFCVNAWHKAEPGVNYIEDIKLSHEDGIWQCDKLICPTATFGCKILRRNTVKTHDKLERINICYNENKEHLMSGKWTEAMATVKNVNIDVNSFIGADTVGVTGYSRSSQEVIGTIEARHWQKCQEVTDEMMHEVDDATWELRDLSKLAVEW